MQHDISKLRDQVQQISLSERVTKNEMEAKMDGLKNNLKLDMEGLKNDMKANMDDMKNNMEDFKNGLKSYMEGFKEGLTRFLQEMLPNGDKVFHETHDENIRNVNHYFRDSHFRMKINHIPNINMRKFDGNGLVTWILEMEHFFDLHNVQPNG